MFCFVSIQLEEFQALTEDLDAMRALKDSVRSGETKVQQLQLDQQETSAARAALAEELTALQAELRLKEGEMAKQGTDWAARKACLEAEIRDFREELESRRKGQTQAEIAGTDLEQE